MQINFYPEYNNSDLVRAAEEFSEIWTDEGATITDTLQNISGLEFREKEINALVFEGMSYSRPLQLRASLSKEEKKATLVHELSHRICFGNKVRQIDPTEEKKLAAHKVIFLILYDVLGELYGEDFAAANTTKEQRIGPAYRAAWDFALSMTAEQRAETFKSLLENR